MIALETHLRARRDAGRKLLLPYVTGMIRDDWVDVVRAIAAAGADAIEIGIPFSDPVMDGPTIQEASQAALDRGATPAAILDGLRGADAGVPLVAMTYYNLVFRSGHERFAAALAAAGVSGVIVPDIPLEESGEWERAATDSGVATVLLAAPVTPDDRLKLICDRSRGFVYVVSLMGVTGERASVAASAGELSARVRAVTDKPVVVGFGISTPEQAAAAASVSDGVVVASALMRRLLDGATPEECGDFVASLRAALDT